jgi:hypothetical protein
MGWAALLLIYVTENYDVALLSRCGQDFSENIQGCQQPIIVLLFQTRHRRNNSSYKEIVAVQGSLQSVRGCVIRGKAKHASR